MKPPIFIVGANRSGTTLLRLILNAHSEIAIPDELLYFDSYPAGVPIERWKNPELSRDKYEWFIDYILDGRCSFLSEVDKETVKEELLAGPFNFKRPYQIILDTWAESHDKSRWGEKTPSNVFYADILMEMFPDASFLNIVRDPRAGVASMQKVSFFPDDIVFNAFHRRKHWQASKTILSAHVPTDQLFTFRYEDLVREPESTTRTVCEFLGERYEPSMLRFYEDSNRYMKDEASSTYNTAATRPISDSHIDAWKSRLDADSVAVIERVCAEEMERFDYSPSGLRLPVRKRAEIAFKDAYWKWKCWRFRHIRHYTVKHPVFARTRHRIKTFIRDNAPRRFVEEL